MVNAKEAGAMSYAVPKLTDYSSTALDSAMRELLSALEQEATSVGNELDWKAFRDRWMGRKSGVLTQVNELWLKPSPREAKRETGQKVNEVKKAVEETVNATLDQLKTGASDSRLFAESLDITLPGIRRPIGAEHPVIRTMNEIVRVFRNLGYSVEEGPEV